jgi:uncharacterized membrane protein YphA (DoxX/SURF4 family)
MFDKKTLSMYAFIVGAFFIVSGVGKVINTTAFSQLITQYGLEAFRLLAPPIVLVEILLGLFLIFSIDIKRSSFISLVLLIVFTIAFAYAYFKNGVINCGCFGTMKYSELPPSLSFIRNFILIFLSFIVWIKYPKERTITEDWKKYFIIAIMSLAIFVSGYTFRVPVSKKTSKIHERYLNKHIKDTDLSSYVSTCKDSTYLIFCFSYTCPHCLNSIENLKQYDKSKTIDRILTIAAGKTEDKKVFFESFEFDLPLKEISSDSMKLLIDGVPTAFIVKHDTIIEIIPGSLPSHVLFKKYIQKKEGTYFD